MALGLFLRVSCICLILFHGSSALPAGRGSRYPHMSDSRNIGDDEDDEVLISNFDQNSWEIPNNGPSGPVYTSYNKPPGAQNPDQAPSQPYTPSAPYEDRVVYGESTDWGLEDPDKQLLYPLYYQPRVQSMPQPETPNYQEPMPDPLQLLTPTDQEYLPDTLQPKALVYQESLPDHLQLQAPAYQEPVPDPLQLQATAYQESMPDPLQLQTTAYQESVPDPLQLQATAYQESVPDPLQLQATAYQESVPDPLQLQSPAYQEPVPDPLQLQATAYQEPVPDPLQPKALANQESIKEYLQLQAPAYQEPVPDPLQLQAVAYQEPLPDPLQPQAPAYQEPVPDPLLPQALDYQESLPGSLQPQALTYQEPSDHFKLHVLTYQEPVPDALQPEARAYQEPAPESPSFDTLQAELVSSLYDVADHGSVSPESGSNHNPHLVYEDIFEYPESIELSSYEGSNRDATQGDFYSTQEEPTHEEDQPIYPVGPRSFSSSLNLNKPRNDKISWRQQKPAVNIEKVQAPQKVSEPLPAILTPDPQSSYIAQSGNGYLRGLHLRSHSNYSPIFPMPAVVHVMMNAKVPEPSKAAAPKGVKNPQRAKL
ncbi:extensin-like [Notolabrus celidotus]|uniref:extensin-like n=1 Tax=Notolabrus celidotus TaxID=1203425 RepID=UPI00148FDDAE|nr:extensin-like [Notolabrus celidotus]